MRQTLLIPKPDKDPTGRKKNTKPYRQIFLMNTGVKFSTKYQQKNSNSTLKGLYTITKLNLYLECKEGSKHKT